MDIHFDTSGIPIEQSANFFSVYSLEIQAISAILMVSATVILLIITNRNVRTARRMADIAREQFRTSQRPYLNIDHINLPDKDLVVLVKYSNVSEVPVEAHSCILYWEGAIPDVNNYVVLVKSSQASDYHMSVKLRELDKTISYDVKVEIYYRSVFDTEYYKTVKEYKFKSDTKQYKPGKSYVLSSQFELDKEKLD